MNSGNTISPLDESPSRRPGQSSDEKLGILEGKLLLWIVIIAVLVVIVFVEWMYYFIKIPMQPMAATILAACLIAFSCWKISQIKRTIDGYRKGRDGEREVARTLENLIRKTGCYNYHDIVCESNGVKFNIDHIIVSTLGIFVIETKYRSQAKGILNKVEVFDGKSVKLTNHPPDPEPIDQVRRNVRWLQNHIPHDINGKPIIVTGIVVYPGWWVDREIVRNSKDAWVSNAKYLEVAIPELKLIFTPKEVDVLNEKVKAIIGIEA
jgi:hypothetical protein